MKKIKLWKRIVLVFILIIVFISGFVYFTGASNYLSDKPEDCSSCHAMKEHYIKWQQSPHNTQANCNSCHVLPVQSKYERKKFLIEKAVKHTMASVTGIYNKPVRLNEEGRKIVEINCLYCHYHISQGNCLMCHREEKPVYVAHQQPGNCTSCHSDTGHKLK